MLFPGETDHDQQFMIERRIQEPDGWNRVSPYRIDAVRFHLREILAHLIQVMVFAAGGIGPKGAIGHAIDEASGRILRISWISE